MNNNKAGALDRVLASSGAQRLRHGFRALAATDRREALRLLDDANLQFPSLFTVLPVIATFGLTDALSRRNFTAVAVCAKKHNLPGMAAARAEVPDSETLYQALAWMFGTGWSYEAPSSVRDDYEAVIDYVAALLIMTFEDMSILRDVARLIFKRHRRGRLIHDLVWCFFQTLDRDALAAVAENLLSQDERDVALAGKLLSLEVPPRNKAAARVLHGEFLDWLDENRSYMYVTGEHFQQTSRPMHLSVDPEAKYLGRELSPRYHAPLEPLSDREITCLHEYRGFSPEEQELLTEYSHRLRNADPRTWDDWMQKQVAQQVLAAKGGAEAL